MEDLGTNRFDRLLGGLRGRDVEAADEMFRHFHPQLLRYLRAKEVRHADDLAGEVWLRISRRIDEFEGTERDFRIWLFTLARREVINHRRKGLRRRTDTVDLRSFDGRPGIDLTDVSALESLGVEEAVSLVQAHLTEEQADVILLRVIGELDARTVAEIIGRDESWVRVTQHRALARLAKRLGPKERWT